jgi:hypothetical protein
MHLNGSDSAWRMTVSRFDQNLDLALWLRQRLGLAVPAHPLVPDGPLADGPPAAGPPTDAPPADGPPTPGPPVDRDVPASEGGSSPELADQWLAWWLALVTAPDRDDRGAPRSFLPPDLTGLAAWPALRTAVRRHGSEGQAWHAARKRDGVARLSVGNFADPGAAVVADVARSLGRPVRDFSLELLLLPVRDDTVRPVTEHRYLVPERAYDAPAWRDRLRELVLPIA